MTRNFPLELSRARLIDSRDHTHLAVRQIHLLPNGSIRVHEKTLANQINRPARSFLLIKREEGSEIGSCHEKLDEAARKKLELIVLHRLQSKRDQQVCETNDTEEESESESLGEHPERDIYRDPGKPWGSNMKDKNSHIFKSKDLKLANTNRVLLSNEILTQLKHRFEEYNRNRVHNGLRNIASELNLNARFVYMLMSDWRKDPTLSRRYMENIKVKLGRGRDPLTEERLKFIKSAIEYNPKILVKELTICINRELTLKRDGSGKPVPVKPDAVLRYVKDLGYRQLKADDLPSRFRNLPDYLEQRQEYALRYLKMREMKASVYFFFWTPISRHINRKKTWVHQSDSEEAIFPKEECLHLFAVMGRDHMLYFETEVCSFSSEIIMHYMKKLGRAASLNDHSNKKHIVVEGEELFLNDGINVVAEMNHLKFSVVFLPAYSHLLNPVNGWFAKIKKKLPRRDFVSNEEIIDHIKPHLENYKHNSLAREVTECESYLQTCLRKEEL